MRCGYTLFAFFFVTQKTTTMAEASSTSIQGDDGDRLHYQDEEDQEQELQPQTQDPHKLPSPDNYSPTHHYGQIIDQDEAEVQSLVSSTIHSERGGGGRFGRRLTFDDELEDDEYYDDHEAGCCKGFRCLTIAMILVLMAATLALLLPIEAPRLAAFRRWRRHHQLPIEFDCPAPLVDNKAAANFVSGGDEKDKSTKEYDTLYQQITENITHYLHHFRTENYDDWVYSYEYVKNQSRPFKAQYFAPNLKNNDVIFESACGVGLNLYMTLEILQEFGIENLVVYGTDYLKLSTTKATVLFEQAPPAESELGIICPSGDSTHLDFVPSNAFDLAYTGYIR
jgi:hypothetical protein